MGTFATIFWYLEGLGLLGQKTFMPIQTLDLHRVDIRYTCPFAIFPLRESSNILLQNGGDTVFPGIVSAETIFSWKWKMWKFSYSFWIMAIFYSINWIVAAETIEGGKIFKGGNNTRKDGIWMLGWAFSSLHGIS